MKSCYTPSRWGVLINRGSRYTPSQWGVITEKAVILCYDEELPLEELFRLTWPGSVLVEIGLWMSNVIKLVNMWFGRVGHH